MSMGQPAGSKKFNNTLLLRVGVEIFINYIYIYDTSNVTDKVFAIFSKLCKTFNPKFQGSAKNI